jgi:hypothetical protein
MLVNMMPADRQPPRRVHAARIRAVAGFPRLTRRRVVDFGRRGSTSCR